MCDSLSNSMSNSSKCDSIRTRKTPKKFGIDDFAVVENCFHRKSSKTLVIDLWSNSSEENERKPVEDDESLIRLSRNKRSLRSKTSINDIRNESNCHKSDSSKVVSKAKPKKRQTQQYIKDNELLSDVSNTKRILRSNDLKINDKTDESIDESIDELIDEVIDNNKNDSNKRISIRVSIKDMKVISNSKSNALNDKKSIHKKKTEKVVTKEKSGNSFKDNKIKLSQNNNNSIKKSVISKKKSLDLALNRLHSSSTPESLPCRESHFKDIFNYVESKLLEGIGGCMYISGVPGTGKTATVYEVKRKLESCDNYPSFKFIEINGLRLSDPFQCYVQILHELTGEKRSSYNSADILNDRFSSCDPNNQFVVLLVDELDLLRTRKQNVLYHLFDWPTRPYSKLIVLAIANAMDLPEKLMINRVSSRLGLTRLSFHPYSYKELETIISSRLQGLNVFDSDALQLICRKVAAVSGDARRALDICRRSVEIAQMEDHESVSMKHVDSALQEIFNSLKIVRIRKATTHEKLFLQAIVQEFRISGVEEASFGDVYKHHIEMSRFEGHYIPSTVELAKIAYNLHSSKLIILENSNSDLLRRIRLNVSVDDINFALKM